MDYHDRGAVSISLVVAHSFQLPQQRQFCVASQVVVDHSQVRVIAATFESLVNVYYLLSVSFSGEARIIENIFEVSVMSPAIHCYNTHRPLNRLDRYPPYPAFCFTTTTAFTFCDVYLTTRILPTFLRAQPPNRVPVRYSTESPTPSGCTRITLRLLP